ncbi:hypothetical protein ACFSR7_35800 [Cohnella sp. GCM10020058]|uniref:hypothetical protein n=1 Tax=Cohnella sp. GCM10020058 TaxID=3317330 RepID=UPI00363E5AEA
MNLQQHLNEITRLRREADNLPEDNPSGLMEKIRLLAKCMVFVGRVSSVLDGDYKRVYAERKRTYAQAYMAAPKAKDAHAELAVIELREKEAQAYEDSRRWRNALDGMTEEIHSLKLKMRIDFADGNNTR